LNNIRPPVSFNPEIVTKDRYLLSAPNPDEWFGSGRPYRATLNDTRGTFADALMHDVDVNRLFGFNRGRPFVGRAGVRMPQAGF
jgi:hypothetical protein